jgi:hypothetical protein
VKHIRHLHRSTTRTNTPQIDQSINRSQPQVTEINSNNKNINSLGMLIKTDGVKARINSSIFITATNSCDARKCSSCFHRHPKCIEKQQRSDGKATPSSLSLSCVVLCCVACPNILRVSMYFAISNVVASWAGVLPVDCKVVRTHNPSNPSAAQPTSHFSVQHELHTLTQLISAR